MPEDYLRSRFRSNSVATHLGRRSTHCALAVPRRAEAQKAGSKGPEIVTWTSIEGKRRDRAMRLALRRNLRQTVVPLPLSAGLRRTVKLLAA